ncbi:MAG: flagellar biosynthesis protein FlhB [Syntrophomonadaceae bacterium]|jgi:flagellar biosynthetic protein FlhB|nr:flagellar biosynthesis protein FlhB [Bacillota bacterium]
MGIYYTVLQILYLFGSNNHGDVKNDMNEEQLWLVDLQLFAEDGATGEKTEQATPRRREEARRKGQVFKSTDLNAAIIMVAGSAAVYLTYPYIIQSLQDFTSLYLLERAHEEFTIQYIYGLLLEVLFILAKIGLPIMAACFVAALLITYLQVGFVFSGEPLTPKLERLNPVQGFQRIFSKRALVELVKSLLKVAVTGWIVYTVIRKYYYVFPRFVDMELIATLQALGQIIFEMAMKVGVVFVIIGVLDYLYQWFEHEKTLKMSKYDVKQEYKETEGDPLIRSRQRQIQREVAMRRMMAEVPKADVIITNPTHFAVALRYEVDIMDAPVVIAKGQDYMAAKIREIADEYGIMIVENPLLARTLYNSVEIGQEVPEELYHAVAEVLAFVYRQKKKVL